MGELEFSLKEIVKDLRETVKDLEKTVNNMSNNLSNDYQKKSDCEICKTDINGRINSVIGWLFGAYALVITGIGIIISIK